MEDPKTELVRNWLTKANSDLRSARILAQSADAPRDTAIYHCQQAGEKAVKGFLAWSDHPLEKTHDIRVLAKLARNYEPGFGSWLAEARRLTKYATQFRYPREAGPQEPDAAELNTALDSAQRLCEYVTSLLPPETHPRND